MPTIKKNPVENGEEEQEVVEGKVAVRGVCPANVQTKVAQ